MRVKGFTTEQRLTVGEQNLERIKEKEAPCSESRLLNALSRVHLTLQKAKRECDSPMCVRACVCACFNPTNYCPQNPGERGIVGILAWSFFFFFILY